jgi:hypothetical protein
METTSFSLSGQWKIIKDEDRLGPQLKWEKGIKKDVEVKDNTHIY